MKVLVDTNVFLEQLLHRENYDDVDKFLADLKKGEKISEDDIGGLRTEKVLIPGLEPKFLDDIIGAVMARDAEDGKGVEWKDVISF